MENNESTGGESAIPAEARGMNFFQRLGSLYYEPSRAFEDINRRPTWLGVFIVVSIMAIASTYLITNRIGPEAMLRKAMAMNPMTRNLSEEQIEQAIARQRTSTFSKYSGYVFAPVGVLVGTIVIASAYLLVFLLLGGSAGFKKSLAVTFWGYFPTGLLSGLLGILMMFIKDPDTLEISPQDNVASNLGFLVATKEHPAIHSLLGSIDIFSIWTIVLLAIGFAAVSDRKLTTNKAATGVVILWILWILGKAGFAAAFS
jgi:hypothetical protein